MEEAGSSYQVVWKRLVAATRYNGRGWMQIPGRKEEAGSRYQVGWRRLVAATRLYERSW